MIRIDLLHGRNRRLRRALMGSAAFLLSLALVLAGLYWVDQRYPLIGIWNALWPAVDDSPKMASVPPQDRMPDLGRESEPAARTAEEASTRHVEEAGTVLASAEAGRVSAPAGTSASAETGRVSAPAGVGRPIQEGESRIVPRWSAACAWAVKLSERLPSSTRLTSLNCRASGEYTLEGIGSSHGEVEGFLETLRKFPSRVSLSWWSEGLPREDRPYRCKFTFQGQFTELYPRDLEPLSESQAGVLGEEIATWARHCGLREVSLNAPIEMPLPVGRMQRRQKVWATGSYAQIDAFLARLKLLEQDATLDEIVLVPVYHEVEEWEQARLYAVIDVLVRRP